jgi:hypothetical protein
VNTFGQPVNALRAEVARLREANPADERAIDVLLSALDASMLDPAVQRYVNDLLFEGERPTPQLRARLLDAAERALTERRTENRVLRALVGVRLLPAEHQAGLALARTRGLTLPALLRLLLTNELALEPERSSGRRC